MKYYKTALEEWVTKWYLRNKVLSSHDMDIFQIALKHGIYLHKKPMLPRYDVFGRYKGIIIDSREKEEIQREQFFHELCHVLRHCGHQSMIPEAFRELQERDARHFTLYAALPSHMIKHYDFTDELIIGTLSETFKVRKELVVERLDRIYRNQKFTISPDYCPL
ncbi:ImmA/IrrE family metallo-endopeptidase [Piscibacillus salipiscarius]|uniref:ImmA/IrrE family metallo-endopeptidase n=1 Tax=Piscibacillus salipiscarius TaxID=299480 RepID=A0ABW5Q7C1_9BACI|nr:ImmA/IrrE family metallo-endopeptidase [Piscibacillus salipiscarius]